MGEEEGNKDDQVEEKREGDGREWREGEGCKAGKTDKRGERM